MFTLTDNGALTHATTGSSRVDFFFQVSRNLELSKLHLLLEGCVRESVIDTLRLIFHLRDCRGGKGERLQFKRCVDWMLDHYPGDMIANIKHIPEYGYYKDLWMFLGTSQEKSVITMYAEQLKKDLEILWSKKDMFNISLAVKYAPREKGSLDKSHNLVYKVANELGMNKSQYRKTVLKPLTDHLAVVEKFMCNGDWESIDFSDVPSIAGKTYAKAFLKHDTERYNKFIANVNAGEIKMNVGQLFPHQIVGMYINNTNRVLNPVAEAMWTETLRQIEEKGKLKNSLTVVDVSGSMDSSTFSVKPINIAVSLGIIIAHCSSGPFHNKWITFSDQPTMEKITGDSLFEQIRNMVNSSWGFNTNFQKVFTLILDVYQMFNVLPENQIETVFCISDMQFDCAGKNTTNFEAIDAKFKSSGYNRPKLVFWNVGSNSVAFPVKKDCKDTALVSGFSKDLLELFLDCEDMNPDSIMKKAISSERYKRIARPDDKWTPVIFDTFNPDRKVEINSTGLSTGYEIDSEIPWPIVNRKASTEIIST